MTAHDERAERARLYELRRLGILDSGSERPFDLVAEDAAASLAAPVALVTFIDERRQWFKAAVGTDLGGTPREMSFCTHALGLTEPLVVRNAAADDRFARNPLVTGSEHVRFYAGARIESRGQALGTVCVLDREPRDVTPGDLRTLTRLARVTSALLDARQDRGAAYTPLGTPAALAFAVLDEHRRVVRVSEAARGLLGLDAQVVNRDARDVLRVRWVSEAHELAAREAVRRGKRWTGPVVVEVFGATMDVRAVSITLSPSPACGGLTVYFWNVERRP
ncbi:GAF domain-containing protein [Deinococcus pimensis]|uniref:GAF domain-containing protein n=1 Tax=Deinococcus pimensis TaxID=309888 RepID=UPI0004AEA5A3|nr:GAF domain-containing protein [Deinococcus pimensis]